MVLWYNSDVMRHCKHSTSCSPSSASRRPELHVWKKAPSSSSSHDILTMTPLLDFFARTIYPISHTPTHTTSSILLLHINKLHSFHITHTPNSQVHKSIHLPNVSYTLYGLRLTQYSTPAIHLRPPPHITRHSIHTPRNPCFSPRPRHCNGSKFTTVCYLRDKVIWHTCEPNYNSWMLIKP